MMLRPLSALVLPVLVLAVPGLAIPAAALAHEGIGANFRTGVQHPLGGLDHFLAMVAVGLWAAAGGGRAIWAAPCVFVAAMAAGGALGMAGVAVPGVEPMILASVIVLGALVGLSLNPPLRLALPMLALFGLMHGAAHGQEAPGGAMPAYVAGFVLGTVGLHLAGVVAGLALRRGGSPGVLRLLGAGTAAAGAALALAG